MPVKLIAKITPAICNKIDEHILDALKEVGEELGLSISINGGRYGATSYTPKLQLALISEDDIKRISLPGIIHPFKRHFPSIRMIKKKQYK